MPEREITPSVPRNTGYPDISNNGFNSTGKSLANALSVPVRGNQKVGNLTQANRFPRYAIFIQGFTTQSPDADDVKIVKLYDFSCINNGENLSFAQVLRQIGKTLQQPVTMLTTESKNIDSWNNGRSCPESDEISRITNIPSKIDGIVSQVMGLLPGSQPLAITQYIVGPLLEFAANALEGKPTSPEQAFALVQQVTQQARDTIMTTNHLEQMRLRTRPTSTHKEPQVGLPIFHIKDGVNHINLENKGKVNSVPVREGDGKIFAVVAKGAKGAERRHQVYFNHLAQKWEMMGDGRFNRFSKKEQRLVYKFSLGTHYRYQPEITDKTAIYGVLNPFFPQSERLQAVGMFGQLVPYRYDVATGQSFIYDASQVNSHAHEVVLAQNEWHLKAPLNRKIRVESLYSPEHGGNLNVAVVREVKGREILAQVNPDTGFFWGKKFIRNEDGNLEPVSSKLRKHEPAKNTGEGNNNVDKKISDEEIIYDEGNKCYRVKRELSFIDLCSGRPTKYPVIGEGSISTVYDTGDGYVVKKYTGKIDPEYKSRLQYAKNNAKGFNRYYGESSGFVSVTPDKNGFASVSVRLKKIDGVALNNIKSIADKSLLTDMLLELKSKRLAENLANLLRDKGIAHYDINQGNVIYSKDKGFSIIDFDSAIFAPEQKKISQSITDGMRSRLSYVLGETKTDIRGRLSQLY